MIKILTNKVCVFIITLSLLYRIHLCNEDDKSKPDLKFIPEDDKSN